MTPARAIAFAFGVLCLLFVGVQVFIPSRGCALTSFENPQACAPQLQATGDIAIVFSIIGMGFIVVGSMPTRTANRPYAQPAPPPARPVPVAGGPHPGPGPYGGQPGPPAAGPTGPGQPY